METPVVKINTGCISMMLLVVVTIILVYSLNTSNRHQPVSREFLPPAFKNWTYNCHQCTIKQRQGTKVGLKQSKDTQGECHILHHSNSCNTIPNFFLYPERRDDFKDVVVNFMHIPKSGGTSIKECMKTIARRHNMTSPVLLHTDSRVNVTESVLNEDDDDVIIDSVLFMGDYSFGFCDVIHEKGKKCSTFVMLREPFDRLVSHYFYCRQLNQSAPGIPDCRTHPIKEWAMSTKSILWNEFFTDTDCSKRQDGKWSCSMEYAAQTNAYTLSNNVSYVQSIVANLDKHFSVIGLTEDFPNSLKMLQMAYNMSFYDVCGRIKYNVGTYETVDSNRSYLYKEQTKNTAKLSLTEDDEIKKLLLPEIEIYKRAREIFSMQQQEMDRINKLRMKYR